MPTSQTPNYALIQWSQDDHILMEDFNADNAKIDAALASQAETLTDHAAVLTKLSNCRVHFTSLCGQRHLRSGALPPNSAAGGA